MVLGHCIIEGLVNAVLTKTPHIMKQPHHFGQLHIVLTKLQMQGQFPGNGRNIAGMLHLYANSLHNLFIVSDELIHVTGHPGMHFL